MGGIRLSAGIVSLLIASTAAAEAPARDLVLGRVEGIYLRVASNLYREARSADYAADSEKWVVLRVQRGAGAADIPTVMALVSGDKAVARGDMVEVRMVADGARQAKALAPVRELNRVTQSITNRQFLAAAHTGTGAGPSPALPRGVAGLASR